jgi:hypothetical protein
MNNHYNGKDLLHLLMKHDVAFIEGNIIKYVFRWKKKGGVADLEKALDYLQELIKENKEKEIDQWISNNTKIGLSQPQYIREQVNAASVKPTISCSDSPQKPEKWQGS